MVTQIWVNIGSGNSLLPDGTKPFTWSKVDLLSNVFFSIHLRAISHKIPMNLIHKVYQQITCFNLQPHLSGANKWRWLSENLAADQSKYGLSACGDWLEMGPKKPVNISIS